MNPQIGQASMKAKVGKVGQAAAQPLPNVPCRPQETDSGYFLRRSGEERAFAAGLVNPRSRMLHLELADRYAGLAAAIHDEEERFG